MKKISFKLLSIIILLIIIIISVVWENNRFINKEENEISNSNKIEYINLNSELSKKVLLAGLFFDFNYDNEVLINESEIESILESVKLKKGIYITEDSRETVKKILYDITKKQYNINKEGYLENIETNQNDIEKNLNEYIKNPKHLLILDVNDTYATILGSEIIAGMIENTVYVQNFNYNDDIKISIINSERLSTIEDLTNKDIGEEILLNILNSIE